MMMKHGLATTAVICLSAIFLPSCEDECYCPIDCPCGCNHAGKPPPLYKVTIETDWSLLSEEPNGMTIMLYPEDESGREYLTHEIRRKTMEMHSGKYKLLLFNLSDGEFGSLSFKRMSDWQSAGIYLNEEYSSWYQGTCYRSPEEIASVVIDSLEVQCDTTIQVRPVPIPKSVYVSVPVVGLNRCLAVRGAISGCNREYLFFQDSSSNATAGHLLDSWTRAYENDTIGQLRKEISSFDIPQGETDNYLTLQIKYTKDSVYQTSFKVTDLIQYIPDKKQYQFILQDTIYIPSVPSAQSGGASITVDDWPDEENIEIIF